MLAEFHDVFWHRFVRMNLLFLIQVHDFEAFLCPVDVDEISEVRAHTFKNIIASKRVIEELHPSLMPKVYLGCFVGVDICRKNASVEVDSVVREKLDHLVGGLIKEQLLVLGVLGMIKLEVFLNSVLVYDLNKLKLAELFGIRILRFHALHKGGLVVKTLI